jgi:hypothetical protein
VNPPLRFDRMKASDRPGDTLEAGFCPGSTPIRIPNNYEYRDRGERPAPLLHEESGLDN